MRGTNMSDYLNNIMFNNTLSYHVLFYEIQSAFEDEGGV